MSGECSYREVPVLDSAMAYRESGDPSRPVVLFLHGNPTSSYIWRNITPHVAERARCIAPDLIGFGRSGKPEIEYRFVDHVRYLDALIEALGLDRFYIAAQDWGTALAFHYAARYPSYVLGLCFMEFIRPIAAWEDFHSDPAKRALFQKFRTPAVGETLIMEQNAFIEKIFPGSVIRPLDESEMAAYREPFPTAASRKPIWRFPNELPIAGYPEDVCMLMEQAHRLLFSSQYPKLLFSADPGVLTPPAVADDYASRLQHCKHIRLGRGAHYLQEDHSKRIGMEISKWIAEHEHITG